MALPPLPISSLDSEALRQCSQQVSHASFIPQEALISSVPLGVKSILMFDAFSP